LSAAKQINKTRQQKANLRAKGCRNAGGRQHIGLKRSGAQRNFDLSPICYAFALLLWSSYLCLPYTLSNVVSTKRSKNFYLCDYLNFTNMENLSIKEFYKEIFGENGSPLDYFLDSKVNIELGHFNVFDTEMFYFSGNKKSEMTYNRRLYYKISLIKGKNIVEYADKTVLIEQQGILFATPRIPYRYIPQNKEQSGFFCVFTKEFMSKSKTGLLIDDLPIYQPNSDFVYQINDEQYLEMEVIFRKMDAELSSDYAFKYDLLRNYVLELIHTGQKLKPIKSTDTATNAASRISSLFIELLERQFPIENETQVIQLKTPIDFATTLGIHINHLNKVLKETTGKSTIEIVNGRIAEEAKILLKQTQWNVSEIAFALGFDEVAHFSNFFKKQTTLSPLKFRN
jgi:AraC family transcriptional activator of pobA